MCAKSSTFVPDLQSEYSKTTKHNKNQFFRLTKNINEGSCKSSVSSLTQLDEAEAPKF